MPNLKKEKKDMIEHLDNLVKNSFKFQKMFYKKFNKNKKEGEELQQWLMFRKRGGKVPNGKAYTRKEKHKKSCNNNNSSIFE